MADVYVCGARQGKHLGKITACGVGESRTNWNPAGQAVALEKCVPVSVTCPVTCHLEVSIFLDAGDLWEPQIHYVEDENRMQAAAAANLAYEQGAQWAYENSSHYGRNGSYVI